MRFLICVIVGFALVVPPGHASAVPTATVSVPEAGDRFYWFSHEDISGKEVQTTPKAFKEKKATVDLPLVKDEVPKCSLHVVDAGTGNEAVVPVEPKPGKPVKLDLRRADFDKVRRIEVEVTDAKGEPAAAGLVKLEDSDKRVQTQILDPSAGGIVQFTDVPAGTVKVTVVYGEEKTASQDVDLALDREQAIPRIEVPVAGAIETLRAAAVESEGREGTRPARAPVRGINFVTALVGLVLFIAIVYAAYVTMRNRGLGFQRILRKFGVELPVEQPPEAAPRPAPQAVEPGVCEFCGQRKDPATGQCACSITAAPAPGAVGSGPRLVAVQGAYAGGVYEIQPGTVTIGREESNAIALPQDSTVSRKHARITGQPGTGEFTIYDEGSSNGTFVNGVRITEQVLHPGDEIQIGGTKLRFET